MKTARIILVASVVCFVASSASAAGFWYHPNPKLDGNHPEGRYMPGIPGAKWVQEKIAKTIMTGKIKADANAFLEQSNPGPLKGKRIVVNYTGATRVPGGGLDLTAKASINHLQGGFGGMPQSVLPGWTAGFTGTARSLGVTAVDVKRQGEWNRIFYALGANGPQ